MRAGHNRQGYSAPQPISSQEQPARAHENLITSNRKLAIGPPPHLVRRAGSTEGDSAAVELGARDVCKPLPEHRRSYSESVTREHDASVAQAPSLNSWAASMRRQGAVTPRPAQQHMRAGESGKGSAAHQHRDAAPACESWRARHHGLPDSASAASAETVAEHAQHAMPAATQREALPPLNSLRSPHAFAESPGTASFHTAASQSEATSPWSEGPSPLARRPLSPLSPQATAARSPRSATFDAPPVRGDEPAALRVHCVTWNIGRVKLSQELTNSLPPEFFGLDEQAPTSAEGQHASGPDVIVVGAQENANAAQWLALLSDLLKPQGYWLPFGGASVNSAPGGSFFMTVAVFVRQPLLAHVSGVRVGRVTCGMGNKVRRQPGVGHCADMQERTLPRDCAMHRPPRTRCSLRM
jgi:hypothetical protein